MSVQAGPDQSRGKGAEHGKEAEHSMGDTRTQASEQ